MMKSHLLSWLVLAAIVAGLFAAALPGNAQAQNLCRAVHVVKANETLKSIAKLYGVNARALAKANDMANNEALNAGDKLCIPKTGKAEPKLNLAVYAQGGTININATGMTREEKYQVKVREGDAGKWYKLGKITSGVEGVISNKKFPVPDALKNKVYLTVCLKNQNNDALTCRAILNVP